MATLLTKEITVKAIRNTYDAYKFKLEVIENSTSTENNTSNITINHYAKGLQNWEYYYFSDPDSLIKVDDVLKKNTTVDEIYAGDYQLIGTWTGDIEHEDDGSRSISVSATYDPVTEDYDYIPKYNTISGTVTLTKIPRATTCPNVSGNIESTYTIALNPAISTFIHSLYVEFGSITGYVNASGNLQSTEYRFTNPNINFTIPSSFYSQFTGKNSTGTLTLKTYEERELSGQTVFFTIGTDIATLTANCLESRCRPKISGTLVDSNDITIALTGDENSIIRGYSTALLIINIVASTSENDTNSTITSKSIEGTTFTDDIVSILKAQKKSYTVFATNSREFSNSAVIEATGELIEYFKPSLNVNFYRESQTSSTVKLTYSGTFFNQKFGSHANSQSNSITMQWYYRLATATDWILGGTITPTLNGNEITETTITLGTEFAYNENYRFKLEAIDLLDNGNVEQTVIAGIPNYSHGKNWFQHHTGFYFKSGNEVLDYSVVDEW